MTITAGRNQAPIVFEADADARPSVGTAVLVGRSRFGDRKDDTFDVTVRARTEAGEAFLQEVFIDVNG